ncbi:class I SAM-dependent methyltransferase [Candidatus Parcubacteria bacterium]|nr:class I SAM-dependent methyltransferase [Candidatus Parcubacteria bacterium]
MNYQPQVSLEHYSGQAYKFQDRWNSYFHQLKLVESVKPQSVLEIGVGSGVVERELRSRGFQVTTLDIAEDLKPNIVGSVTSMPVGDKQFDLTLAAEILEHIKFEDVPTALKEIVRVSKSHAVISIPHPGYVFSQVIKLPLLPRIEIFFQVPFFWQTHVFNGEHYWELGKKGFEVSKFLTLTREAGLELVKMQKFADDPAHRFFLFKVHA